MFDGLGDGLDDELVEYLNEGSSLDEVRGLIVKGLKAKNELEKIWYLERIADIFDVPHHGLGRLDNVIKGA